MTRAPSLVGLFVAPLNQSGIEYMVTGGLAAVIYGHPRLTLDVDLVVRLSARDAATLAALWPAAEFYVSPAEVIREESERPEHGHFDIIHHDSALRADVYVAGTGELNTWALRRRVVRHIEGQAVQVAPIEAVILGKLRYAELGGSDRHLRDVARMLEISGGEVDQTALSRWIERLGPERAWAAALRCREPE